MTPDEFQQIAELFPDAALLLSNKGSVLAANRAASALCGSLDGMSGRPLTDFTADPPDAVHGFLRRCAGRREPLTGSLELIAAEGQNISCDCYGCGVDLDSQTDAGQVILRLEPQARQSQPAAARLGDDAEWFSVTLSSIGDAVITTDGEGRVTFLNPVAEGLTGWTLDEARNHPLDEVFRIVNEFTRQTVENPAHLVLREGNVVGLANHTILIARDGREIPIDDSGAPIRDNSGRITGVVLIFRDVTDRKHAERNLRESEERKSAILNTALDCIITIDHQGQIVEFNPAAEKTFGYRKEDVLGHDMAQLIVPPSLRQQHYAGLARYLETGEGPVLGRRIEMPALCADGSECPVELAIVAIERDGPPLFTAYLRDLREVKRTESRRAARLAVTQILAEATSVAESMPLLLQSICKALEWDVGAVWRLDHADQLMHCIEFWHRPSANVSQFEAITRESTFAKGIGLPGRIWASGQADWIPDAVNDTNFPRAPIADREGLHGGFGVPITVGPEFLGVIEFFSSEIREPDDDLKEMMSSMGGQIGQFLERRRAEEALRESEEKFRLMTDTIPQLAWIARPDGYIFWYNRRWHDYTGTSPEQMEGWGWQSVHDPTVLPEVLTKWKACIATGEPFDMVFPLRGADGQFRPFLTRVNPLYNDDGRILYWFGTNTDISEQQRSENTSRFLAQASATLAAVMDYESTLQKVTRLAVPSFADWCAVDMLDDDGRLRRLAVSHVDPAKVELAHNLQRRYPPDPTAPQGVWNIIRTGRSEMVPEITDDMLRASIKDDEQLEILRQLGLKSYIGVPLGVRGKTLGVLTFITAESGRTYDTDDFAVAEDLAHRAAVAVENARLYQALREADRRKDEFLALLGHELRNPLAPISNALHVMKLPQVDGTMRDQARDVLERQVEHMVRLVDDLLDVSRIMRNKIELRRETIDLSAVIERAVETVQPVIDAEGHRLDVSLSPHPLRVDGDILRLSQVIANLLNNAAKYTEEGGVITLSTSRENDHAVVRVHDTGIGISPEVLARIFEMFFQAERRTKDAQGGLGIGLSLVHGLVESHGGSVEAHSAGPGKGSEFVVRLPLLAVADAEGGASRQQKSATERLAPRRVLVVDDNTDAADSLAILLRLLKQEVVVAYDGVAALEQAELKPPAIAFVDLGMPRMDGYELARRFKAHPALASVLLVAITGWGQPEDRQRTKETGFDHHLVKPVEADALRRVLSGQSFGDGNTSVEELSEQRP